MHKAVQLFKDWMLPLAIVTGIGLCLFYHFTPFLKPCGALLHRTASEGQRLVIALLLLFQFVQVSPHEEAGRILLECAMLCLICPTASAAGVITRKLDGDLAATVTYLVLINVAATFLIPMIIPLVRPSADLGFWAYVARIARKVFPVLILPGLVAWAIRYTLPHLQRKLLRLAPRSFYIWFFGLTLAMVLSTHALLRSRLGAGAIAAIVGVSLACCAVQFFAGRRIGRGQVESITAGQALGQKNTGFLIWLGYNYLTPVTSVAGGLYAIWQNLFNSWELYVHSHRK